MRIKDEDGKWVDGVRRGIGAWKGIDRTEYHGEFRQCTFHGAGYMREEVSGVIFHGKFEHGLRTGNGVILGDDGYVYAGSFDQDLRNGSSLEILAEGDIRVAADVIYERDILIYRQPRWVSRGGAVRTIAGKVAPKLVISGMDVAFESVLRQRSRPFNLAMEGASFTGQTREQKIDGRGRIVYSVDDTQARREYEGGFHAGKHHGVGVMFWRDGSVYSGQWHAGTPGGFGVHTFSPEIAATKETDLACASSTQNSIPRQPLTCSIDLAALQFKYEGGMLSGFCDGFGVLSAANGSQLFSKFIAGQVQGYSVIVNTLNQREILLDGHKLSSGYGEPSKESVLLAAAVERLARRAQTVARAVAGMAEAGPAVAAAGWRELETLKWTQLWSEPDL